MTEDDDMLFEDDAAPAGAPAPSPAWQVLVVDDEVSVHQVTQLVMSDFTFDGRPLRFTHCYSAAEARAALSRPNQFALILLDVVMESEHAGLDLVKHIREELGNGMVRIVLRTGQPGQAPQAYVLKTYDINDYREKTDLTHAKLSTVFYSALRAYRDLTRLERARAGLRRSIDAITQVCDSDNLRGFCSAVLEQASALLGHDGEGVCASRQGGGDVRGGVDAYAAARTDAGLRVLAVTPAYAALRVDETLDRLPLPVRQAFIRCMRERRDHHGDRHYACYYRTREDNECLLYMAFSEPIGEEERELLGMFSANVAITYEKLLQREEIAATQEATVAILGEALERRSAAPGAHVRRVGAISAMLADAARLAPGAARRLRLAAPLHDVGHAAVPDDVLNTPGPLDDAQWGVMRRHCEAGRAMLAGSPQPVLKLAAAIAHEHHERWDGAGYPRGLSGERISMAGRIVALADFVDAMVSPRCYRPAWPLEHALEQVRAESGKRFDPALALLLLAREAELRRLYE
ncbi:HD domain-containing phosphohydrolase [Pseudoduganella namucuonensis]|uniref:Response regulator c-di-GMP phosphodiesterase, RpfG family, contains REC and HD-GYP domains n=1 Tax=Pseudoduganella namucuonensis TaxID=1035707 RepID=A0A1I7LMA1_9BURK|nr:HD domain-containing phosphohydrolase [Pseudoduganella namucuonensis]SFV10755.1 Response regulator c-di-GMP phosphodiesterase, RpfG family, contains REC and HD-GYP domains [Pseudoduganella namucuonensis]